MRTRPFGQEIFFVQKSTEWGRQSWPQRLGPRKSQNEGKYPWDRPPQTARNDILRVPERPRNSRRRRYCVTRAREWRDKPRHGHADGATGGSWCGLLTISGARLSGRRRRRQVRMYSKAAPGGGGATHVLSKRRPCDNLWSYSWLQGAPLVCAGGPIQTPQYQGNKKFLRNFCTQSM